jgi:hypothetical protein
MKEVFRLTSVGWFQHQQDVLASVPFLNVHKRVLPLAGLLLKAADSSVHPVGISISAPLTFLPSRIWIFVPVQVAMNRLKPAVSVLLAKMLPVEAVVVETIPEEAVEGVIPPDWYLLAASIHPASEVGRGLPSRSVAIWAMGQTLT